MKCLVVFKLARNPQDARISGENADWKGVRLSPGDDDHATMDVAKQIAQGDEIVAVTIGDGDVAWAASRGASRTILVEDVPVDAENALIGRVISGVYNRLGDLGVIVMGDTAWDYGLCAAIAGNLDMPAVAGVTSACMEDNVVKVTRKIGSLSQVIEVAPPVLLSVAATAAEKQAPGMKDVLAARKKPVERLAMKDLVTDAETRCQSVRTRFPDTPPAKIIDGSNPAAACVQLLDGLRIDGVI